MLNSHLIQLGFLQYLLLHNDHDVHATIICTLREVVSNLGHAYLLSQFGVVWSLCNVIIGSFIAFQIFLTLDMVDVYSRMKAYKGLIVNQISWPLWQYYHNLLCVWRPNDLINKFQNNKKNGRVSSLINPILYNTIELIRPWPEKGAPKERVGQAYLLCHSLMHNPHRTFVSASRQSISLWIREFF